MLFPRRSTRQFIREAWRTPSFSLGNWIHGYVYGRWVYQYISIGKGTHPLARLIWPTTVFFSRLKSLFPKRKRGQPEITFSDTYHGKVIAVEEAKKLVTVNQTITVTDLEQVIPYQRARSIILHNPEQIVVLDCPCRMASSSPCSPIDVCLIIGEPFASFVAEHHPHRSRRINRADALDILEQEHRRGHVQHAFFKEAMLNRFYAICNCCSCCCGAISAWKNDIPMLAPSGYAASIDGEQCTSCGTCIDHCPFEAISFTAGSVAQIAFDRCLGCGVCVDACCFNAISLKKDPEKGEPLVIDALLGHSVKRV